MVVQTDEHSRKPHTRPQRLGWHAARLVVKKTHSLKKQRGKALFVAGASLAVAFALLGGLVVSRPSHNSQATQAPKTTATPAPVVHQPVVETLPPVQTETPQPSPTPKTPKPTPPAAKPFSTPLTIKGNDTCQTDTLNALRLLADKAPAHYAIVTSYVSVIECVAQGSGMAAYENPPRYMAGNETRNAGTVWYAGTIAHDAGHSKLYADYKTAHPGLSVPDDIWTGQAAEAACLDAQYDALQKIGADQSKLDYIKNVIATGYWNISYDQRWW